MNDEQLLRYSRHILLSEFGIEGQERLRAASALIVGAGGLGCPAALYLAASGIGRLTIADGDKVDLTNLQRQILYRAESVGAVKVEAARQSLNAVNPEVEIVSVQKRLDAASLAPLVSQADVVLDCTDNFATRHAINRACVRHAKLLVSGAAIRFDGQLMVFDLRTRESACYACLFPEDAQVEEVQCSTMGVFAPLTGVIGALQAVEAIKLLAAVGESSNGRLQVIDAKTAEWRSVRVKKDPACGVCSKNGQEPFPGKGS
ncbi:MAG TPA: molybdopterin-synthase adenylyltransferase MoeB [Burkholderiales bacterium]|nr:molybdopterin-synthase adenylyltransferase MoeB [Burkholderiales bacterium]